MRKYLFLSLLLSSNLLAQSDSIPIGKITYSQQVSLPADIQNNGYSTLLFNKTCSVYIQNSAPTKDSSVSSPQYLSMTLAGDSEGFPIYKLHSERKMFCKIFCRQSKNHCIVSDTFGTIVWTQHPEHKRFGQYDCRRATGKFRGREYEAWYTLDIPIPSGPYKLGGLPGLILEATSADGKVKFLFDRLEMSSAIPELIKIPRGKDMNMTYKNFIEGELKFNENLEKDAKARGIEMTVTRMESIELDTSN
ncbi:MAG: GLPGLI family protein [Saprospiraceae bacterium]|nr:GLPGLI family protein [Saprospiraceae bacterium]